MTACANESLRNVAVRSAERFEREALNFDERIRQAEASIAAADELSRPSIRINVGNLRTEAALRRELARGHRERANG